MPGEDQGVAPVLAPGQLGSQAQRGGHNQQIFHKDNFCISLLILHSAYLKSCHWVIETIAFTAQKTDFCQDWTSTEFSSAPQNVSLLRTVPLNWIFTDAGPWAKWKIQQKLHLLNQSFNQTPQKDRTNVTRGSASKDWAFMHRHRAQGYRVQFTSNWVRIPILYTFSKWRSNESGYPLEFGYTYMPFYCCLGHASSGRIYEIIILWPPGKEARVTNSTLSFQTLGLDWDHTPKVRVSQVEDLLPNCSSLMVPRKISQDSIFELCNFVSHTKEPSKLNPEQILPSNLLQLDRSSLAFNWKQ